VREVLLNPHTKRAGFWLNSMNDLAKILYTSYNMQIHGDE